MSLTLVICKLLERLIKEHSVDFLIKNNLINCFLDDVTKWVDEGSPVDIIIYLSLNKPLTKCHIKDDYLN